MGWAREPGEALVGGGLADVVVLEPSDLAVEFALVEAVLGVVGEELEDLALAELEVAGLDGLEVPEDDGEFDGVPGGGEGDGGHSRGRDDDKKKLKNV